jgi:PAS domain S-box-containing protein
MENTILVDLHCHSIFSDGELAPETLAANLAAAGVRCAALTDHDSLEGLPRFHAAIRKLGVADLSGVELTVQYNGREAHLLGYGFDPDDPDLTATVISLRQVRDLEVHSIAGSLRKIGSNHQGGPGKTPAVNAAPNGMLEIGDAIALLHRAGGRAFWAHPALYEPDPEKLNACVAELKSKGLDGLEAVSAPPSDEPCVDIRQLAIKHELLICGGTDFHLVKGSNAHPYGVEISRDDWTRFRDAVLSGPTASTQTSPSEKASPRSPAHPENPTVKPHNFRRRSYILRILLPTLIAIGLFLGAIWGIILPSFEKSLLDRKRELIHELTNSVWSILSSYERDEESGLLTREQAQTMAIARIEALRYGPESKDYFWIQDMQPRMIMHPYRSDLNGQDLSSFTDPRGVAIFVQFADLVGQAGEGYIDYVWQWNDDPQRLEPKQSYVKGFTPWGWVIGTGIYTDDVHDEIARIERSLINTSLVISGMVVLLLLFVLEQSLRIEHERQDVLDSLRESTERYHTLIEATSEGTLMILDERCRYANPIFLSMTGYTTRQLEFLDMIDFLPRTEENQAIWERIERITSGQAVDADTFEGVLKHADGRLLDCILAINPIMVSGQRGFILLARDIARQSTSLANGAISHAALAAPVGIFRARAARRAVLMEMNPAARTMLTPLDNPQPALADLFADPAEFDAFIHSLRSDGEVRNQLLHLETKEALVRLISLSAQLVRDETDQGEYIDGILEDVTTVRKQEAARESLIEKLQTSLLFLHEPISHLGRNVVICDMNMTVAQLSRLMTARNVTAALVASENAAIIGIITDHDLRARVLAEDIQPATPIHAIMSSPLTKIPEDALVYEALMRMEEKGVRHLAVESRDGQIVSVIDGKSLIQFQRYGPIVLSREIARAASAEEVAQCTGHTPPLVMALLESSARPRHVTNMVTSICDAATERLVQLAVEELGPPPATFSFIAMGSQGRQEQTLVTDQDNGIIFTPPADSDPAQVSEYFLQLGKRVCDGLNLAGYRTCPGRVMAENPRWSRSLPEWISGFNTWVAKSEPQEIIDLSIFFDFRTVCGEADLAHQLRQAIHTTLNDQPAFFPHFAQNAQLFKPPFHLLGKIYLGGGATEHAGEINLKDAMMPIVSFARLYALRHQINQTHTIERIDALCDRNIILPSSRDEIVAAYDFLMHLRLQNQVDLIQAGNQASNVIHPGKLGSIQQELLKQVFAQITAVQKKVSYDFLGGT